MIAQDSVSCSRPSRQATLFSRQPRLPAGEPGLFIWNTTVLFEVSEPMMQWKLMITGMTALNTVSLLSRMLDNQVGRKARQEKERLPDHPKVTPWVELVSYCLGVQLTDHIFDRICINNEAGSVSNQAEGGKAFPLSVFPIRQYDEVEIQQPSLARSRMRSLSLTHLV